MPGLAFGALLLAPFIDRGPERRPLKRPLASGFMLLAIASIFYLTWESVDQTDWEAKEKAGAISEVEIDKAAEGYKIAEQNTCLSCHGGELGGGTGPQLTQSGLSAEEIAEIAVNGKGGMPAGIFKGTEEELKVMSEFIAELE